MATVVDDHFTNSSRFYSMMGSGLQHQSHESHYTQHDSRSQARDTVLRPKNSQPQTSATSALADTRQTPTQRTAGDRVVAPETQAKHLESQHPANSGASLFPSPPNSSSPSETSSDFARRENATPALGAIQEQTSQQAVPESTRAADLSVSTTSQAATGAPAPPHSMPSPDPDTQRWNAHTSESSSSRLAAPSTEQAPVVHGGEPNAIHIRDIAHIRSLARDDVLSPNRHGILNDPPLDKMKYEISGMPIDDVIEMVSALLTKITTTNDLQHDALNRNAAHVKQAQAQAKSEDGSEGSPMSSSVLAFHGKNVPAITILSYLSRIHKYCPTTYEVFLSLLVYFDRMTERVNQLVVKSEQARERAQADAAANQASARPSSHTDGQGDAVMGDDVHSSGDEIDSDLADDDDDETEPKQHNSHVVPRASSTNNAAIAAATSQATFFVVDSFNIHRLVIAGVTCASKFFSDVFYTNSRYAKVGGLPLAELNHLELQFLLLNDFRLAVPVEDLEAYATMLVEFYAREVVGTCSRPEFES